MKNNYPKLKLARKEVNSSEQEGFIKGATVSFM